MLLTCTDTAEETAHQEHLEGPGRLAEAQEARAEQHDHVVAHQALLSVGRKTGTAAMEGAAAGGRANWALCLRAPAPGSSAPVLSITHNATFWFFFF